VAGALVVALIITFAVLKPFDPTRGPRTAPLAMDCPTAASVVVDRISVPAGPVAGYCQQQLLNAAQVMRAARVLGLNSHAQAIGVMTAIGESGLRNIAFGDKAGPDSRGLFQQRKNWGPLSARMDPYTAARAFYSRMIGVPDFNKRPPTEVAHLVQGNADPNYYTKFWVRAEIIVETLRERTDVAPWE
jgi:hypothetical protein